MTARTLTWIAAFATLVGLAGCAPPGEPPLVQEVAAVDDMPKAQSLPVAPPPRPAGEKAGKTTAELLVGSWTLVKSDPPLNRSRSMTIVFTQEGRYSLRVTERGAGVRILKGKYQMVGKTISLASDPDEEVPTGKIRNIDIESITDRELKIVGMGGPPFKPEHYLWKRTDDR